MARALIAGLLVLLAIVSAVVAEKEVLVILDDLSQQDSFSKYFGSLRDRGYVLTFARTDEMVSLELFGEFQFDGVVFFAAEANTISPSMSTDLLINFIDEGGDLILGAAPNAGQVARTLARAVGVEIDRPGAFVMDHFAFDTKRDQGEHTTVLTSNLADAPAILGTGEYNPILYRGTGMTFLPDNTLVFPLLSGSSSSYSFTPAQPIEDDLAIAGSSTRLVAALQARNNARVVVSGSLDLFSDEFFTGSVHSSAGATGRSKSSGNEKFVNEVSEWVFHEKGVLRLASRRHNRVGESEKPEMYIINEEIEYVVLIEEYSRGQWQPYQAVDVQLEFSMLDPYWRLTLSPRNNGELGVVFKAPDVYGVFTFNLDYHRAGYSSISDKDRIVVRPLRHDEYERYIPAAFPYYASAFSMLGSVVLFSVLFVIHKG